MTRGRVFELYEENGENLHKLCHRYITITELLLYSVQHNTIWRDGACAFTANRFASLSRAISRPKLLHIGAATKSYKITLTLYYIRVRYHRTYFNMTYYYHARRGNDSLLIWMDERRKTLEGGVYSGPVFVPPRRPYPTDIRR